MKRNLIFAIDCDEVLRCTLPEMVRIYNEEIGDAKQTTDIVNFNVDISFPRIYKETGIPAVEWFFDCHSKELFLDSKPIKGTQHALKILSNYGKVVILTYQKSCENKLHTIEWLCKHKLMCDDICFLKDKYLLHCDYLVDDNIDNFRSSNAENAILISAPYNDLYEMEELEENGETIEKWNDVGLKKVSELSPNSKCVMRFDTLLEFARFIDKKYKTKEIEI